MSTLTESLAYDRHAARYAKTAARGNAVKQTSTRSRAGWLLVGLGLRLALPGGATGRGTTLVGR